MGPNICFPHEEIVESHASSKTGRRWLRRLPTEGARLWDQGQCKGLLSATCALLNSAWGAPPRRRVVLRPQWLHPLPSTFVLSRVVDEKNLSGLGLFVWCVHVVTAARFIWRHSRISVRISISENLQPGTLLNALEQPRFADAIIEELFGIVRISASFWWVFDASSAIRPG